LRGFILTACYKYLKVSVFRFQVSAQPQAKQTAGLIEKETYERRTSNAQHRTSNIDDATLCPFYISKTLNVDANNFEG